MERILTNRDLYRFVARLIEDHAETERPLARYLGALRTLLWRHRARPAMGPETFAQVLADAFVVDPRPTERLAPGPRATGFDDLDRALAQQIADLAEMGEAGTLESDLRAFGVDAPSGAAWYNFDVATYLECATDGAFGGWKEGDDTSRIFVPDEVSLIASDGRVSVVDPHEVEDVAVTLSPISWADVLRFVECGQDYE